MNTDEFNKRFGSRLSYYLEQNGKMQKDLCEYLGVSKPTVCNWCKGLKSPRMNKIDEICTYLNITRTHLLGSNEEIAKLNKELEEKQILSKFNELSESQQEQLLNYADFLLQQQKNK